MTPTPDTIAADLLLDELTDLGISVRIGGGNLRLCPKERLTPSLHARLRVYKPLIVRAMRLAGLTQDQRDAWDERVAICMVDGGLSQEEAEALAWREVEGQQGLPVDAHVGPRAAAVPEGNEVAKAGEVSPRGPTSAGTVDTKGYQ